MTPLAQRINALLPQTQCTRCGYPDCASYAVAIADDHAPINQCPPGGAEGIARLAAATARPPLPLSPDHGVEGPRTMAVIDENWCIGCTLCLAACPTDAILGGNKMMHTVIEAWCTGCELCVPVCPVDCISLENATGGQTGWNAWSAPLADTARLRYEERQHRLQREAATHEAQAEDKALTKLADLPALTHHDGDATELARKRAVIDAALARARQQRNNG